MPELTFTVQLNRHGAVFFKTTVKAKESGIVGDWYNGKPYQPDSDEVRAAIPFLFRPAFDRAVLRWSETNGANQSRLLPLMTELRGLRGQPLGTLFATPNWESTNV
jgi:hypothetical protein